MNPIKIFPIFLLFLNIKNITSVLCVMGKNCPEGRGICMLKDYCACLRGYKTLIKDQNITDLNSAYCNYEQTSKYIPLILEIFLPSTGHFYVGRYFHALVKFLLIFPVIFRQKDSDISVFLIILFCLLYVADLFCIFLGIYHDGNGIAFY